MVLLSGNRHPRLPLKKILILPKKMIHMMYFMDIHENAIIPLFIDADILPVTFMYISLWLV